jgi:hypothetical protein
MANQTQYIAADADFLPMPGGGSLVVVTDKGERLSILLNSVAVQKLSQLLAPQTTHQQSDEHIQLLIRPMRLRFYRHVQIQSSSQSFH